MMGVQPDAPDDARALTANLINAARADRPSDAGPSVSPSVRAESFERRRAAAILAIAVALGGFLRFYHLGATEMSADEGASWAAASASSITQVLQLQPRLNPGKFAVHDVALHGWIRVFGDGLVAMRALSAIAGMLGIIAVFFMVQELLWLGRDLSCNANGSLSRESKATPSYMIPAGFAAMLFGVNLVFIKYAREARMYSVALLFGVIQVELFLRSVRRPTITVLILAAFFTALSVASTFTMLLILVPELVWLANLGRLTIVPIHHRAALAAVALGSGLLLLIPPAIIYLNARTHAPALLAYAWASPPPFWAPLSMFNKATGTIAFPVLLGLALWGVMRRQTERDALLFALFWMIVPPLLVLAASYLIRPAFVERYMLASFVPFFLFVALGLWNVKGFVAECGLMALVALLSLGHVYSYWRRGHGVQWREAVQIAAVTTGRTIVVVPPYAADVVRYYLRDARGAYSVERAEDKAADVAIIADSGVAPPQADRIAGAFPRLLIRLRGVMVRGH
jgi:mannosyltransferase